VDLGFGNNTTATTTTTTTTHACTMRKAGVSLRSLNTRRKGVDDAAATAAMDGLGPPGQAPNQSQGGPGKKEAPKPEVDVPVPPTQQSKLQQRKASSDEAALTAKNYRMAKELVRTFFVCFVFVWFCFVLSYNIGLEHGPP
jgi:hypothetical protein